MINLVFRFICYDLIHLCLHQGSYFVAFVCEWACTQASRTAGGTRSRHAWITLVNTETSIVLLAGTEQSVIVRRHGGKPQRPRRRQRSWRTDCLYWRSLQPTARQVCRSTFRLHLLLPKPIWNCPSSVFKQYPSNSCVKFLIEFKNLCEFVTINVCVWCQPVTMRELGSFLYKGISELVKVFEISSPELSTRRFPLLRTAATVPPTISRVSRPLTIVMFLINPRREY